jgi:hypothetical protein
MKYKRKIFKKQILNKEFSRRYFANILQIFGLTFCSTFGAQIFEMLQKNDFSKITNFNLGFFISTIGIGLILWGYKFMIKLDFAKEKNIEQT